MKDNTNTINTTIEANNKMIIQGLNFDDQTINTIEAKSQLKGVFSSGSINLNKALGINGFPYGRIIEIYGSESSGKTTIALQTIKEAMFQNKRCLFIDAENALDNNYVKSIGIDTSKLLVANPLNGERVFEIIEYVLENKLIDLIVVDSVAAMVPKCELEAEINDQQMGAHARLMSKGLRRIQSLLSNNNDCTIIFLNQVREKIGVFFGNPETTTGGRALKFFSSIRLEVKRSELIKDAKNNEIKVGIRSKINVVKNKMAPPLKTTFIDIYFNNGYNSQLEIIDFAIQNNIIQKNGSWYAINDNKVAQGKEQLKKYMQENYEIFLDIQEQVIKLL